MSGIIKAEDLTASGNVIMLLFALRFPDGLTIEQMQASGEGWLVRAAERLGEAGNNE